MTHPTPTHQAIAWTKQRLVELDAIIAEVERHGDHAQLTLRNEAVRAAARLRASRAKVLELFKALEVFAQEAKRDAKDALHAVEDEWVEIESTTQAFATTAKLESAIVRDIAVARADAQRKAWEAMLATLHEQASHALEEARGEWDRALKRLSDEADAFQARIGDVKDSGDESWSAVRRTLADAKLVHVNAIQKIKQAFAKIF